MFRSGLLLALALCVVAPALLAAEKKTPLPKAAPPDVVALAERTKNSVVVIRHYGRDGKEDGVGAGFVVGRDGLIATCLHVVGEARPVSVELADGRKFDATEIYASDRKLDLAIVRIPVTTLSPLRLADSSAVKQGEPVVAIGNPVGLDHSVVQGIVSAKRDFDGVEMIQLAIPIEPGNSGGPLLDAKGHVLGLLNMKSAITANLGFAIPANALQTLLDRPNPVAMEKWLTIGALDPREWKPLMGGRWRRKAGRIQVENPGTGFGGRALCLWQGTPPALPYEVAVEVKLEDEAGAAGLAFASDGHDNHYGFYPTAGQMRLTWFGGPSVFNWSILKEFKTAAYKPGDWNHIRVRVEQDRILGYVNGELVLESNDAAARAGQVGLAKFRDTRAEFRNFYAGPKAPDLAAASRKDLSSVTAALSRNPAEADLLRELKGTESSALIEKAAALEKQAQTLRQVASELSAERSQGALVHALEKPEADIDLFEAALLVSKLDNEDLDLQAYRDEIARLAGELTRQFKPEASEKEKLAALTKFLFSDYGFHGSRSDYYNAANSYINEVLDDREGLPITLSVVFIELGRRVGITNLHGIPVPTRFMVRFDAGASPEIIDVFDAGKSISRSQAVELVADNTDAVGEKDFEPATKRDIIIRMLRNLMGVAQRGSKPAASLKYLNAIIALNENAAMDRLNRAGLQMRLGNSAAAKADLRWLLDHESKGVDQEKLLQLYRSL